MKRILTFIAFMALAGATANAQSVLERVVDALVGDSKKEDRSHKTINAGGQAALVVPQHIFDTHKISWWNWEASDNNKVRIVSYEKNNATILGIRSTPSTIVNFKYHYKTTKEGKEVTESGAYPFTIVINKVDPTSITISQESTIGWGVEGQLRPTLHPDYSEADMQFDSDNTSVVTVNSRGVAYGVALGDANVTIRTSNGLTTSTHVTCVIPDVSRITITGHDKKEKLYEGDTLDLSYLYAPEHAEPKVKWSTSDKEIATVDDNGHVTITGHGTVHIYCTNIANGVKADIKLKPKKSKE